ncbi:glucokinase [Vitiosangium sp. GDMCC 1.1324]|uniref:glucokinase n=1 Tax=Vitiosangium sp. (strain GDMCC 1.1324) TaxID=2138576 RepID=UPI000D35DE4D|nr:glucokinase [Vitiosangium sp. GDMCC 1.1324]PTL78118.1 glucokinase [Vitiosangium sp. GDMCC 1.1324]
MMVLAGDVGGTKTALALVQGGTIMERRVYPSAAFASLEALVGEFLGQRGKEISRVCFGIAGPVIEDSCRTTNLRWVVDARSLERSLGVPRVSLINDFHAMAIGISVLPASDFAVLNDAPSDPKGPWVLIGAGTGLGEAVVVHTGSGYEVVASEGGHTDFAPRNELEMDLLRFLLKKHARVSYERIVSGRGLVALYEFVRSRSPEADSSVVSEEIADSSGDAAPIISSHGLAGDDPLCVQALSLFVSIYGAEAGNLALKVVARGGVFVSGGIAPKILPKLLDGTFRASFVAKGRLSPLLETTPVKVVVNSDAGLLGAAEQATRLAL